MFRNIITTQANHVLVQKMRSKKLLLAERQHQQEQRQQRQVDPNPLQYEKQTEDNKGEKKMW